MFLSVPCFEQEFADADEANSGMHLLCSPSTFHDNDLQQRSLLREEPDVILRQATGFVAASTCVVLISQCLAQFPGPSCRMLSESVFLKVCAWLLSIAVE